MLFGEYMSKIFWLSNEYRQLAQAMLERFPDRRYDLLTQASDMYFTIAEFEAVMRSTLPPDRQRNPSPVPGAVKNGLYRAISMMRAESQAAASDKNTQRVRWTDGEWRYFSLALHKAWPDLDFLNDENLAKLHVPHLNKAAKVMTRPRTFTTLAGAQLRLMAIYGAARATRDPLFYGAPPAPQEPALQAVEAPAAAPSHHDSPAPAERAPIGKKIFWTKEEWVQIAAELHRLYPHHKYPERSNVGGLKAADISHAQRVLPADRQRNLKTTDFNTLRTLLIEAFKTLRRNIAAEQQRAVEAAKAEHTARVALANSPPPNPWEEACKPLVALLLEELRAQLLPMMTKAFQDSMPQAAPAAPVRSAPVLALVQPPRLSVGVYGNRNSYADELRREFPQIDFTFIDNHKKVDSIKNCAKIIVLTKFIPHAGESVVRRAAGDRFVPINGYLADMRRVIESWLVGDKTTAHQAAFA